MFFYLVTKCYNILRMIGTIKFTVKPFISPSNHPCILYTYYTHHVLASLFISILLPKSILQKRSCDIGHAKIPCTYVFTIIIIKHQMLYIYSAKFKQMFRNAQ